MEFLLKKMSKSQKFQNFNFLNVTISQFRIFQTVKISNSFPGNRC